MVDDSTGVVALVGPTGCSRHHLCRCLHHWGADTAPVWALPTVGHDRLGAIVVLPVRKHEFSGPARWHCGHRSAGYFWLLAGGRAPYLLFDLDLRVAWAMGYAQSLGLASRPRYPGNQERPGDGRIFRHQYRQI